MRNSNKVLSIALLALSVFLFSCGSGGGESIFSPPPPPPPPDHSITISNLSPMSITLPYNSGTYNLSLTFDQSGAQRDVMWYLEIEYSWDGYIWEKLYSDGGVTGPSPVIQISTSIDTSPGKFLDDYDHGAFVVHIVEFDNNSWVSSNYLRGTWQVKY